MRKLTVTEFVSLDGVMEAPGGELKNEDGGPILIAGSRSVAQTLLSAGLIDEINLQVFPLILGSGMRFYPDAPEPTKLELSSSRAIENGVVLQTYRIVG